MSALNAVRNDTTPNLTLLPEFGGKRREARKKKGQKSEVFPYEVDELKSMLDYFASHDKWVHYLLLTFGCNMARRCGDTLTLTWGHIYNPETGTFRSDLKEIVEDKTDKLANPHINQAVRAAVCLYIEKTGINPADNDYGNYVFAQPSGGYKGRLMTEDGHLKALKKAAKEIGLEKNIGTHSARKTFGMLNRRLHPNDTDSMELLRAIFNHSDTAMTSKYIGLTKEKTDQYYDDMGAFYEDYIVGSKKMAFKRATPIVSLDTNDLRDILKKAYMAGLRQQDTDNPLAAIDTLNELMAEVESKSK